MEMKTKGGRLHLQYRLILWLFLLTFTAGHGAGLAHAQATNAQMSGKVVDSTGAVIPNATIDVQNTGTGLARKVSSSSTGEYAIPSIPVGTYKLSAVAAGFKTYTQSGIVLEGGQTARVDVILQVGSASETVEVSAAAAQVGVHVRCSLPSVPVAVRRHRCHFSPVAISPFTVRLASSSAAAAAAAATAVAVAQAAGEGATRCT